MSPSPFLTLLNLNVGYEHMAAGSRPLGLRLTEGSMSPSPSSSSSATNMIRGMDGSGVVGRWVGACVDEDRRKQTKNARRKVDRRNRKPREAAIM